MPKHSIQVVTEFPIKPARLVSMARHYRRNILVLACGMNDQSSRRDGWWALDCSGTTLPLPSSSLCSRWVIGDESAP